MFVILILLVFILIKPLMMPSYFYWHRPRFYRPFGYGPMRRHRPMYGPRFHGHGRF